MHFNNKLIAVVNQAFFPMPIEQVATANPYGAGAPPVERNCSSVRVLGNHKLTKLLANEALKRKFQLGALRRSSFESCGASRLSQRRRCHTNMAVSIHFGVSSCTV